MTTLTDAEHILRAWLIMRMRTKPEVIRYGALAEDVDPDNELGLNVPMHYRSLTHALLHVNTYEHEHEHEHGRPVGLGAIVVNRSGTAGDGFDTMCRPLHGIEVPPEGDEAALRAFRQRELDRAVRYWTKVTDP